MAAQNPLALPSALSPDHLEALSELSVVLAKVRAGLQSSAGLASDRASGPAEGAAINQLSFKDVPGATDSLKHTLQHARAQVCALPDTARAIEDQMQEIRELEARIGHQRALLEKLREEGLRFGKDKGSSAAVKMEL